MRIRIGDIYLIKSRDSVYNGVLCCVKRFLFNGQVEVSVKQVSHLVWGPRHLLRETLFYEDNSW